MTTIITRYFDSAEQAQSAKHELIYAHKVSPDIIGVYHDPTNLSERLQKADVLPDTAKAYAMRMATGGAVLMVRGKYKPLGVAKITRTVADQYGAVDMGELNQDVFIKDQHGRRLSVLSDHPYMMSRRKDPSDTNHHMANWPIPLISRRKPNDQMVIKRHGRMASWPIGLLAPGRIRYGRFPFGLLVPGHKFMAKFPFGHIVPGHKYMAKFPFAHIVPGHKYMAKFPFGHIVPGHKFMAKFPFGHLVPGHMRMANWPFPLLINGKQNTNSLVPGHKFMAKFPFAHIVPGHKYMAKFPFAHIVPGHKYMANWIFPHTKSKA
jgi:hypothetical protein